MGTLWGRSMQRACGEEKRKEDTIITPDYINDMPNVPVYFGHATSDIIQTITGAGIGTLMWADDLQCPIIYDGQTWNVLPQTTDCESMVINLENRK